eukprot:SAG31_NODE_25410_length_462_cov_0.559229_1_plen_100_part_10
MRCGLQADLAHLVSAGVKFTLTRLGLTSATNYEALNDELEKDGALDDVEDGYANVGSSRATLTHKQASAPKRNKNKQSTPDKKRKPKPRKRPDGTATPME